MTMRAPLAILGSGLAGYSVAREFRKLDTETPIVLVTEDGGEFYSKPMLSNALAMKRTPDAIATSTAQQMAAQLKLDVRAGTSVRALDVHGRRIVLDEGTLEYSKAVLAVGARPLRLNGSGEAEGVYSVNTLEDYRRFRRRLEGCRSVVILGAGFIGCEFANDLRGCGFEVDVVDMAAHVLQRFWPEALAAEFEARLAASGVRWHLGRGVEAIRREGTQNVVELKDGTRLRGDIVLSAVGLAPRTELARAGDLRVARGIVVDRHLRTSDEHVFALGDCAEVGGRVLPFVMPIMHCARALARTLAGDATPVAYPVMPIVLKTPACPAVFLPPPPQAQGEWSVERDGQGMTALFHSGGEAVGAALLGTATARREEIARRLPAQMT